MGCCGCWRSYGPKPRQKLDVYCPAGSPPPEGAPVALFVHGGVWAVGNTAEHFLARFLGGSCHRRAAHVSRDVPRMILETLCHT